MSSKDKSRAPGILITAGGNPTGIPTIRHLSEVFSPQGYRVITCDIRPTTPVAQYCDNYYPVPRTDDGTYSEVLDQIIEREQVKYIIPSINREVAFLAAHQARLARAGVTALVSSEDSCRRVLDKSLCFENLARAGLTVPRSITVDTPDDFLRAVKELGYPKVPVCMKPAVYPDGSGKGFRVMHPDMKLSEKLLWELTSELYYVTPEQIYGALQEAPTIYPILVMEYLPYEEFSVYAICRGGKLLFAVPNLRQKLFLMNSLEAQVVEAPEIIEMATSICEIFGFDYNINIQIKLDADRTPKVVEINPRIGGSIMLPVKAGADLLSWGILLAQGRDLPPAKLRVGTKLIRYYENTFEYPV